ncbi:MAG: hypothetical protein PF436_09055 [Prolixibacteraceae bacterium]|jgi:hypothetical protein|nr:hypothetical protein [Prolixibacteraceae bacterium]
MTTLEIILLAIVYIILVFVTYKLFKRICDNEWMSNPILASIIWPIALTLSLIPAIIQGYKYIYNNEFKTK